MKSDTNTLRALKSNWFLIALLLSIGIGFLLGEDAGVLNPDGWTTRLIVVVLFLIIGLKLPTDRIRTDLANPRLHIYLQVFVFVVVPLYFLTATLLFREALEGRLLVGIFALAVLPTTISSCIVFTQNTGGNTVASVFNASLANTLGIFLSPLLLSILLSTSGQQLPMSELLATLRGLAVDMLLPIVVGQVFRIKLGGWATRHSKRLGVASNVLILLVVLFAFARTAADPNFTRYAAELPGPLVYLMISHLILLGLAYLGAVLLQFNREDRLSTVFVAPQKTLALGVPLLTIFFGGRDVLGVALLPLIIYHPWQLFVAAVLVGTINRRAVR